MTYDVTIEETVVETFSIEASSPQEAIQRAREMYRNCELVLSPGELQHCQLAVSDDNGKLTPWEEM